MYSMALILPLAVVLLVATGRTVDAAQLQALVYRGPAACQGCAEAVAQLLQTSPQKFAVTFVGPNEDVSISTSSLSKVDVYAQPGGPDLNSAWHELRDHASEIRDFVETQGGRYMGFCLGAFLASNASGFGLLPDGVIAVAERKQEDTQVTSTRDTIIQVDWSYRSSVGAHNKGDTVTDQWMYFQDGAVIKGLSSNNSILGRYSRNKNVAASLTPLGKGWVALVGTHPEATDDWYKAYQLTNPDGVNFNIGYDFVNAAIEATAASARTTGATETSVAPLSTSSQESGVDTWRGGRGRLSLQNPLGCIVRKLKIAW